MSIEDAKKLLEAATTRAKARIAAKALRDLLAEKSLSKSLRASVEALNTSLSKTWGELKGEADLEDDDVDESDDLEEGLEDVDIQEPFPNEHAARVRDPGDFEDGSFRSKSLTAGVRIIVGKLKGEDSMTAQTYRFDKDKFTPEQAKAWLKAHKVMHKSFEQATGEKESAVPWDDNMDFVPLVETSVRPDGSVPIKIIRPGWGSSGYYPSEILERDGPRIFVKGTKMFWDHATLEEEQQRPEGSLRNLAAELITDARWVVDHPKGPGLYADAQVFEPYRKAVDELAPHIGVSVRAAGRGVSGSVDGKNGKIITEISAAKSVDFVTMPGAGGQVLQLFEAQRNAGNIPDQKGEFKMDEKEFTALKEAKDALEKQVKAQNDALARLQEGALLREAQDFVIVELSTTVLPQPTRARLTRDLVKNPPIKEGQLDKDALKLMVAEAVKAETAYLTEVLGLGKITDLGGNHTELKEDELDKALEGSFQTIGLSESVAKAAAKGRG